MEKKYSRETQIKIEKFLNFLESWEDLFSISINYYVGGWAIFLREKNMFPRSIVVFSPYDSDYCSIKSFEISFDKNTKEIFTELYNKENIKGLNALFIELKEVIYGKDIINTIKRKQ
ncbi:MAG: hypothetical protein EU532_12410 [Promethearchaeota archaeon]|nr:MAG: hypothetical protein EU532_12410 [Candidatus Lokiarchaeota archaeon]